MRLLTLALQRSVRNLMSGFGIISLLCLCVANIYFYIVKCRVHQGTVSTCVRQYILLSLSVVVGAFIVGTVYNAIVQWRRG